MGFPSCQKSLWPGTTVQLKLLSYEIMERVNSDDDADLSISSFATREPSALTEVRVHESNTTPGPFHSCTSSTQPSHAAARSTSRPSQSSTNSTPGHSNVGAWSPPGPLHSSTNSIPGPSCASSFPSSQIEE